MELPFEVLRRRFEEVVGKVGQQFELGKLDLEMAVRKIIKISESVAGDRVILAAILDPHPTLRDGVLRWWRSNEDDELLFPPAASCPSDKFHSFDIDVIKVLTVDMANRVAEKMESVDSLFLSFRLNNDPVYDESAVGAFGFSATRWREVFLVFPHSFPRPAKIVADAVGKKSVYCVNVKRTAERLGNEFRLFELSDWCAGKKKRDLSKAVSHFVGSKDVVYCDKYFYDVFHSPNEVREGALRHLAAEIHALSL